MSLLFINLDDYNEISEKTLNDLGITTIIKSLYSDVNKQKRISTYLQKIALSEEEILYRQSIIKEFIQNRSLFYELQKVIFKFDKCLEGYRQLISARLKSRIKQDVILSEATILLKDYAQITNQLIDIYYDFYGVVERCNSIPLKKFKEILEKKVLKNEFRKIHSLGIELFNSFDSYKYKITLDKHLLPTITNLINSTGKYVKEKRKTGIIPINLNTEMDFNCCGVDALSRMYVIYEDIFETLYSDISFISEEFIFFEWVIRLIETVDVRKIDIAFPTLDKTYKLENIIDISLLVRYVCEDYSKTIYPNDFLLDASCLIVGSNNTGKTVSLRTIGISQIFFQTGLFVCARSAALPIKKDIISLFSKEEKVSDIGGRFEKEVVEIKEIIDKIDEASLIIVNEIFQSTFSLDGMKCLFDILNYFLKLKCSFITVTHLTNITNKINDFYSRVILYTTTSSEEKYKIKRIE